MEDMKHDTIRTVDDLIDAFGGNSILAEWLGIGDTAVSNWRDRKSIPSGWHLRLYLEAEARGLSIDPRLFGMDDWPLTRKSGRGGFKPAVARPVVA